MESKKVKNLNDIRIKSIQSLGKWHGKQQWKNKGQKYIDSREVMYCMETRILDRLRMKKDIDENRSYEKCNVFEKNEIIK